MIKYRFIIPFDIRHKILGLLHLQYSTVLFCQFFQLLVNSCHRKSHYIIIISVYFFDEFGCISLDSICPGFIFWFFCPDIFFDLLLRHGIHMNFCFFCKNLLLFLSIPKINQCNTRPDTMLPALQCGQHSPCILCILRFSEYFRILCHDGICSDNQAVFFHLSFLLYLCTDIFRLLL